MNDRPHRVADDDRAEQRERRWRRAAAARARARPRTPRRSAARRRPSSRARHRAARDARASPRRSSSVVLRLRAAGWRPDELAPRTSAPRSGVSLVRVGDEPLLVGVAVRDEPPVLADEQRVARASPTLICRPSATALRARSRRRSSRSPRRTAPVARRSSWSAAGRRRRLNGAMSTAFGRSGRLGPRLWLAGPAGTTSGRPDRTRKSRGIRGNRGRSS